MKNQKRMRWLDIIKGICIVTVVLFHIEFKSNNLLFNYIWKYFDDISGLYKVTLFYCVAGITLKNEKLKDTKNFLYHKFKKLYLKAICIGIGAILLHNIFIITNFYKINSLYSGKNMTWFNYKDIVKNIIMTIFLANREVILGAFWFVWSLIISFIILALIELIVNKLVFIKNKREIRLLVTFGMMILSIFLGNVFNIVIPRFSNSLVGVFLIDFTNYLFTNNQLEKNNLPFLICCFLVSVVSPFFGTISMNTNKISSPHFLVVVVYAFLFLFLFVSKKMEKQKIFTPIEYIGKNSFGIMAFHFLGFKIGGVVLNLLHFNIDTSLLCPYASNVWFVIYFLFFGIAISLLGSYILKKLLKFEL